MAKYCKDKDIDKKIRFLIKQGWGISRGGKHNRLISPKGKRITVSRSPSDYRSFKHFIRDIARSM